MINKDFPTPTASSERIQRHDVWTRTRVGLEAGQPGARSWTHHAVHVSAPISNSTSKIVIVRFAACFSVSIVADSDPLTYWIRELSNEVRIGEVRNLLPPTPADVPTVVRLVCVFVVVVLTVRSWCSDSHQFCPTSTQWPSTGVAVRKDVTATLPDAATTATSS